MKIRSIEEFQTSLDKEFTWRFLEVQALSSAVSLASDPLKKTLIRASVAILYAHWEGFIKKGLTIYVDYINTKNISYAHVRETFIGISLRGMAKKYASAISPTSLAEFSRDVNHLRTRNMVVSADQYLKEIGNMNFDNFSGCLDLFGVEYIGIEMKKALIDESLNHTRHDIVHGLHTSISEERLTSLTHDIVEILRVFKNNLEICASDAAFMATPCLLANE